MASLDAGERVDAGRFLVTLQNQPLPMMPPHPDAIAETHLHLRKCIEALANGRHYTVLTPATVWQLLPPEASRGRQSSPITRHSSAGWSAKHMPSMTVLALVEDLNVIGADRLRACPLVKKDGQRCGVIFLARHRRQRYCIPEHAQAAAWQAYEPKRKEERD
jgi:hypothetical protein